jgi:biofilm protein TabA
MTIEKIGPEKITKWFIARDWANGLNLKAHESTDRAEFYLQFTGNRACWDKAFVYLRDTDLNKVAPGKYYLDDDHVYVLVAEDSTRAFEDTKWEAHRNYIDIQYIVRGKEKIGVAPVSKATISSPFNTEKDIGFFNLPEADSEYYVAEPGTFFIFFPQDAHRPCIRMEGTEADKKIVIKIIVSS